MSTAPATNKYDELPYGNLTFPQAHPDRLAAVAKLFGMTPPRVEHCRVLELGCAAGSNLLPMAETWPESRFVGIDLSARQIEAGQAIVGALGLKNLELKRLSILDIGSDFGPFDYILTHGVYSYVPAEVQDKILEVCARNLAPNGVAYVSYTTYPGWHLRGVIRDIMLCTSRRSQDPTTQVREAVAWLEYIAQKAGDRDTAYSLLLKEELANVRQRPEWYLYHEHLAYVNTPLLFSQFVDRAAAKGLQYLGEAEIYGMAASKWSTEAENSLQHLSKDLLDTEQLLDFLWNRTFRQTLLCHGRIALERGHGREALANLYITSHATCMSEPADLHSSAVEQFQTTEGCVVSSSEPLIKAALRHLVSVWPRAVTLEALLSAVHSALGPRAEGESPTGVGDREALSRFLLHAATSTNLVELHASLPRLVTTVTDRPLASLLARHQATGGTVVTNRWHQSLPISEPARHVLRHLDGCHDRADLLEVLGTLVARGVLSLQEDGKALPQHNARRRRETLGLLLEPILTKLARNALLVR